MGRTIPLAPFLEGRGEVKKGRLWRHILHTACQRGYTPLDSPLAGAALQLWGGPSPWPLPGRKGEEKELWGTPPDPCQRGCTPLDSLLSRPVHCEERATWQSGVGTIPLAPFLEGRGKKKEVLRDTLRLLPKGLHPSGLPAPPTARTAPGCLAAAPDCFAAARNDGG